jgi:hypothetical protein
MVIARQQLVSRNWTPSTSGVIRKVLGRIISPRLKNRLSRLPSGFDHIRPMEKRRVADHAVTG